MELHYSYLRRQTEIFSVRFPEFEKLNLEDLYGVILVASSYTYVIFERCFGDPKCSIDSEVRLLILVCLSLYDWEHIHSKFLLQHVMHGCRGWGLPRENSIATLQFLSSTCPICYFSFNDVFLSPECIYLFYFFCMQGYIRLTGPRRGIRISFLRANKHESRI